MAEEQLLAFARIQPADGPAPRPDHPPERNQAAGRRGPASGQPEGGHRTGESGRSASAALGVRPVGGAWSWTRPSCVTWGRT